MDEDSIKFNACEQLDFSDNYSAEKNLLSTTEGTKVFWMRPEPYAGGPTMVQFCKKRGRLNYPEACLTKYNAMCSDYVDALHMVILSTINTD